MSYTYDIAIRTAHRFIEMLGPHCHRIHLAGSLRREHKVVKDIEIVCTPKTELKKDPEKLFDEGVTVISGDFIHTLATITSAVIKGKPEGRYMQIKTASKICPGIYLDLFMPRPEDYYRQLVIRTGSKEYVHNVVATAWKRKGWVGAGEDGLRKQDQCEEYRTGDKTLWRLKKECQAELAEAPPAWQSEQEFFDWLGIKMISPAYREFKNTINQNK